MAVTAVVLCAAVCAHGQGPHEAVSKLLDRVLPSAVRPLFVADVTGRTPDSFEICCSPPTTSADAPHTMPKAAGPRGAAHTAPKVVLRGSNAVCVASALRHFLTHTLRRSTSWTGANLRHLTPADVWCNRSAEARRTRWVPSVWYGNPVSFSYSMAWWTWARWERELDWMAMRGVNMALALAGQEALWGSVFQSMGLTERELSSWFAGPAFAAWQRMGNIRAWGGPLPAAFREAQLRLNQRIVARARELGIQAVLPAFSGRVPEAILRVRPAARITRQPDWCDFGPRYSESFFLDPSDPLYVDIGARFAWAQAEAYNGTENSVFLADQFNEVRPGSRDPEMLRRASAAQVAVVRSIDSRATWAMQAWAFLDDAFWGADEISAYLAGAPLGSLILLDLYADVRPLWATARARSFSGHPFVWCMLNNFGANPGLYGKLPTALGGARIAHAEAGRAGAKLAGVGATMEGIEANDVVWEALFDSVWDPGDGGELGRPTVSDDEGRAGGRRTCQGATTGSRGGEGGGDVGGGDCSGDFRLETDVASMKVAGGVEGMASWLTSFVDARYGRVSAAAHRAWRELGATVYNCTDDEGVQGAPVAITSLRPALRMERKGFQPTSIYYPPVSVLRAWDGLLEAAREAEPTATARPHCDDVACPGLAPGLIYDLVDVTRQAMSNLALPLHRALAHAYDARSPAAVRSVGAELLSLVTDLDQLLATHPAWTLHRWVCAAQAVAPRPAAATGAVAGLAGGLPNGTARRRADLGPGLVRSTAGLGAMAAHFEFNARNQVTLWGPDGQVLDYAAKQWSGLESGYHLPRWSLFVHELAAAVERGVPLDERAFDRKCLQFEQQWQQGVTNCTNGDHEADAATVLSVVAAMHRKYRARAASLSHQRQRITIAD